MEYYITDLLKPFEEQIFLRYEIILKWIFETHDVKTCIELAQDKIKQSNQLPHSKNGENFLRLAKQHLLLKIWNTEN